MKRGTRKTSAILIVVSNISEHKCLNDGDYYDSQLLEVNSGTVLYLI